MTNELAIRILTGDVLGTNEQTHEAVKMAVSALSHPDITDINVGDTIYRQAALDALSHMMDIDGFRDGYAVSRANVGSMLRSLPPAQPEQRWIPCSKRLPDEETDVLVTRTFLGCKDGSHGWNAHIPPTTYVEVAQYFDGEWTALSDEYKVARSRHTNPIAWMPLPEPFAERRQDE